MKNPKKLQLNTESHFSFRVPKRQREYLKKLWTPPENNDADTILNWLYNRGLVQNHIKKLEYESIDEDNAIKNKYSAHHLFPNDLNI